jgi:hypothetical protein
MLSNLNTNMKVLIGISSVAIIGIIYSLIKSFFAPNKKKMVEGLNHEQITPANGNNGNNIELTGVISTLNRKMGHLNDMFSNFKDLTENQYRLQRTIEYNVLFNNHVYYTTIHINNTNASFTDNILTINDNQKVLIGFSTTGLNILSVFLKQCIIDNSTIINVNGSNASNTAYLSMIEPENKLQKHLSTDGKFATIPISQVSSTTIYQRNILHHSHSPVNVNTLTFQFKDDNDTIISSINKYSFDIEIMHIDSIKSYDYLTDIFGLNLLNEPLSEMESEVPDEDIQGQILSRQYGNVNDLLKDLENN